MFLLPLPLLQMLVCGTKYKMRSFLTALIGTGLQFIHSLTKYVWRRSSSSGCWDIAISTTNKVPLDLVRACILVRSIIAN